MPKKPKTPPKTPPKAPPKGGAGKRKKSTQANPELPLRADRRKAGAAKDNTPAVDDNAPLALATFAENAYLDYSMYVILDRALPFIGDGLKPVQRRIVYAMSDLGLHAASKFKKSARTIGDVIGKFHPHGDSACYEAMVLMAQPFSYRYPLIEGQGNFGSTDDPKSFAAMRYTEARLTRYAQSLLGELEQGTVEWAPNFDGTLEEPRTLPARLPNVLLNGASGIAVGMATDIPPHNIAELAAALIYLLDNPSADVEALCEHLPAPDFPTEAEIITPRHELIEIYKSGGGSIRQRAVWDKEEGNIVISALPYQVSGSRVLEQIATQINAKKLPMVVDLRDESDHEHPIRLVVEPRSNRVNAEELMSHLFATTDLERSHRANFNMIGMDRRPHVYDLKSLLGEWLKFRTVTVERRLAFRLDKVTDRLHILDGLLVAYLNIDEVIRIVRSEDEPRPMLMKRFKLTQTQADAILDLRLRNLAKLEEIKIRGEQEDLAKEKEWIEKVLKSKRRLKTLVRGELIAAAEEFGDPRRSKLVERTAATAMDADALTPTEDITVVLSKKGWIRAAKGHEVDPTELQYRSGDGFLHAVRGRSNQTLVALDSSGRSYSLSPRDLPSARGLGEPLASMLEPDSGASFCGLALGNDDQLFLLASSAGYGFITGLADMRSKNKKGKSVLRVTASAHALAPQPLHDHTLIAAATAERLLILKAAELPQLPRGKGVRLLNIPTPRFKAGEESLVGIATLQEGDYLRIHSGKRHIMLKANEINPYLGERARRGTKLQKGYRDVHHIQSGRGKSDHGF